MSPKQFHEQQLAKREIINGNNGMCPFPLKINKSSSSSSSSSTTAAASTKPQQQQRHPVIIYTHSPKIIHTHPRDFMALVQKLTGLSRSDHKPPRPKQGPGGGGGGGETSSAEVLNKNQHTVVAANDDTESSSSVTIDENCSRTTFVGDAQMINSCFANPSMIFDPPIINPNCFNNIPLFTPNPSDFLCSASAQPFYNNYADSLLLMPSMKE